MTLFVTVMVLASAKAQDPYVALPGATHQSRLPKISEIPTNGKFIP